MPRLAVCLMLLPLAGCGLFAGEQAAGPDRMEGWRFASGRLPTRAEYAAVVAACQDRVARGAQQKPLDACLAELGLKRE